MPWFRRGVTPNDNPPETVPPGTVGENVDVAGDPHGVALVGDEIEARGWSQIVASPWSGYPADWDTPTWHSGGSMGGHIERLVDTAWACLDLNSSVLSTMPAYRTRGSEVIEPAVWMANPDPDIYQSWEEFAKQLFWDYQLGEAFVVPTAWYSDGYPARFRVMPPWMINVEMDGGRRRYNIGSLDVTDTVLHIRYQSTTDDARGHGPLEAGALRVVAAGVLARFVKELVEGGGTPPYVLTHPRQLTAKQADDLLSQWWDGRRRRLGQPALVTGGIGVEAVDAKGARDMALLELSQFTEARLSVLLGVPPQLIGLPAGDAMTYKNIEALFDFHDRASLRPKARSVMAPLSGWACPRGTTVELNRDEYTRPAFAERIDAYVKAHSIQENGRPLLSIDQMERMERFTGVPAPEALTGGLQ